MGSSIPHSHAHWIVLALLCGVLYLVFDALRSFALQLSPVRLRSLTGAGEERGSRWTFFDLEDFQLVSGVLLQVVLVIGSAATTMIFDRQPIGTAVWWSAAIWAACAILWKFALALIPEDTGEVLLRALVPFSHLAYFAFWPVLYPLRMLLERLERAEEASGDEEEEVSDEAVQAYIDVGEEAGIIEPSEGKMLQSIVDFGDRLAHEIMTPRIDVLAFDTRRPTEELARLFSESKYSRIPIYHETIDQITGIVHIKELFDSLLKNQQRPLEEMARPPYFVSETKKVSELLRELQTEHLQIAVVVDEYGGTAGIITTEDIVEEIVGEIADEHEDEESTLVDVGDGTWMVSGLLRVEALEETLGAVLEGDDYETVAGLIFTTLGRVPTVGAVVTKNGFRFEVERADRRRIYRVRVSKDPDWQSDRDEGD